MNDKNESRNMWGGRFDGASDPLFRAFNDSISVDHVLVQQDITGSLAWAEALQIARVLNDEECTAITGALRDIAARAASSPDTVAEAGDEDIHAWVERELIDRVGDLGKKLHTGRSRNDQVATDLRLWMRDAIAGRADDIRSVQRSLVDLAERERTTVLPGYTHLQRAQPVLFAHWCLAYFEMLERDLDRLVAAGTRADECPLGSGALAGTSFPIDRDALASKLGFARPTTNSLDAVSDRDFVIDVLSAAALCMVHLSRLAEDLICYASTEFGFLELSDAVTSGSSLMPQKKNPDALELVRGKTGAVFGALSGLLMTLKGTPLAYNKDLQEDKRPLFLSMSELSLSLCMTARVLTDLRVDAEACRRAAVGGHSNATALAEYLVGRGVAFRDAHDLAGRIVRRALERGTAIGAMPLDELRAIAPRINEDVYESITLERVIASCNVHGGTAPERVEEAILLARARLERPLCGSG